MSLSTLSTPALSSPSYFRASSSVKTIPNSSFTNLTPHLRAKLLKKVLHQRKFTVRAIDTDSDTLLAVGVGVAGVIFGVGIPIFYDTQAKASANRENDQPCFPCSGTGSQKCRFCLGTGAITVELGGGEVETSKCINCDGEGAITCTTCQGSGIQPRYLDRREFKDDD